MRFTLTTPDGTPWPDLLASRSTALRHAKRIAQRVGETVRVLEDGLLIAVVTP